MSYYTALILNTFSKNTKVDRYGVEGSITPRGRKLLQLLDLFEVKLGVSLGSEEKNASRRNELLVGIDEHKILVDAATFSNIYPTKQGVDSAPHHLLKSNFRERSNSTQVIFCSSDSSLKPKSNDDLFFSSNNRMTFMLERLHTKYDTELFSVTGKLGKITLYDDYYVVSFYKNVCSYDITYYEEQVKDEEIKKVNNNKADSLTYTLKVVRPEQPVKQSPVIDFTNIRKSVLQMVEHELPNKKDIEQYLCDLETALEDVKEIAEYYNTLDDDEKDVFKFGLPEDTVKNKCKSDATSLPEWAQERAKKNLGSFA